MKENILVMGALGQIGTDLTIALKNIYGADRVVISDIIRPLEDSDGIFEIHDCTDIAQTAKIVKKYKITTIYHLPSILSATAEHHPQKAFNVNMMGLYNTLEVAREFSCRVFTPSTIGVFGTSTPKDDTPQDTVTRPSTMYGVTKLSGELLCDYYHRRYQVDTRGLRYPGIISYNTPPGGGTTDFAVDIYYQAILKKQYTSYLSAGTFIDMMYMPDAIDAAIDLMETDASKLKTRNAFNITSFSIDPEMLAKQIKQHIPEFCLDYQVDPIRQSIADSWPNSIDDTEAVQQWGWKPNYNLQQMTEDMLLKLSVKLKK